MIKATTVIRWILTMILLYFTYKETGWATVALLALYSERDAFVYRIKNL